MGLGSSESEMKELRLLLINSDKEHHKMILKSPDFYSLSTLRDLLFHEQEHRFTLPQIKNALDKLGLKFCGFGQKSIVSDFKLGNSAVEDTYDLDKWRRHEESHPRCFNRMYQFWCQKI